MANPVEFLRLLKPPQRSFFLFGPRGVGKSTWLRESYPKALYIDLLNTDHYLELSRNPALLESKIGRLPPNSFIILDEIQKIPALLDEVHRLIETRKWKFALTGSSARKLKRGGANLLGGRAVTINMEPFSYQEIRSESKPISTILETGCLPLVVLNPKDSRAILSSYVHTYIKEEIKEEGLVRKVDPFLRFLEIAGSINGEQVNSVNLAREARIPRSSVDVYFSILEDTLLGHWLPAYTPRIKVREQVHPKFYWFDSGVARGAAQLLNETVDPLWLGRALETYLFHEMRIFNETSERFRPISFYRTGSGTEIDFVIETRKRTASNRPKVVCIEVKHSKKWDRKWESAMRSLAGSGKIQVDKMIGVYMGKEKYHFDGLDVLPVLDFVDLLFKGSVF